MNTYTVTVMADGDTVDEPFEIQATNLAHALMRAAHLQSAAQLLLSGDEVNVSLVHDPS